jgi:predicted  nucleic acid-binding Zn-ribbon protein
MEANITGKVQCTKCQTVYEPVIKVLERVCPQCLSIKTVPVESQDSTTEATA